MESVVKTVIGHKFEEFLVILIQKYGLKREELLRIVNKTEI